ncbi:hypothetical protein [Aeromonas rivipollensis]|uniref:hypothetical protein n=1 Tax=Aeromonas rivipollensis TaxID=948519 RepID=UPI003D226291
MSLQKKVEEILQKRGKLYQSQDGEILTHYVDLAGNPVVEYQIRIIGDQVHVSHPEVTPLVFTDVGMFSYWLDM